MKVTNRMRYFVWKEGQYREARGMARYVMKKVLEACLRVMFDKIRIFDDHLRKSYNTEELCPLKQSV